ncbi:hypothetical protein CRM22_000990 [Opisthorchis felineus]|uniref:C2H2-type domain-containing protein n=1 Tax=Opisthorchis felineus TaxID=147828 RepID=A0A4S2MJ84_OPIFE|nr:hypothetical protein CRM22_000990 [Opisthorchis felineus]TGZ74337.1 hypothetical protein CRM22_000990 [Opisthorchis felineus]TGZ74338.1 hypothetical protein CRM22_000990 [Opisthorchis felineus]
MTTTAPVSIQLQGSLTLVRSKSPPTTRAVSRFHPASPVRVPWLSYYFGTTAATSEQSHFEILSSQGLVVCPVCAQHFSNSKLLQHLALHLLVDELYLGTLWPYEFCPECISPQTRERMCDHRRVHSHLRDNDPATLLDGLFVCPACELSFASILKFAVHLYERHVFRDAPYVCSICHSFHTSRYTELMRHLSTSHNNTNQLFCPYCLKHFELPTVEKNSLSNIDVFSAHRLYDHMRSHWDDLTYRCDCCRLDFTHRRDLRLHEYLQHQGFNPSPTSTDCTSTIDTAFADDHLSSNQLCLYYSNHLRTTTPRMSLKCLECGESLRQPISRHFNLTVCCPSCRFASSCSMAVHCHWCNVHSAPPVPSSSSYIMDLSKQLTSWERCVSSLLGSIHLDQKAKSTTNPPPHDPCGSLFSRVRHCRHKHTPPDIEFRGLLRCHCGFRTIIGNQMARHLATGRCKSTTAYLDYSPRPPIFSVVERSRKSLLRARKRALDKFNASPFVLQSVGLLSTR